MTELMNPSPTPSAPVTIAAVSPEVEMMAFSTGPFATNCYILIDRSHDATTELGAEGSEASRPAGNAPAVVIDPGYGAFDIVTQLAGEHQFNVNKVVLTHGHIDHFRDSGEFGVPVYVHPLDRPLMEMDLSSLPFGHLFEVAGMKEIAQLRELTEAEVRLAGVDFAVHHMPGHSPGHVMLRVPGFIIGGDVLFRGGVGRTDLPGCSPEDMVLSLKKLTTEFADDDVVLTGHGPATTIGREKQTNGYLQAVR